MQAFKSYGGMLRGIMTIEFSLNATVVLPGKRDAQKDNRKKLIDAVGGVLT